MKTTKGYTAFLLAFLVMAAPLPCAAGADSPPAGKKLVASLPEQPAPAPGELIRKDELLTLDRCIEIALKRQPSILAAAGAVDVNKSKVGEARANFYPQISWNAAYSRISPAGNSSSGGTLSSSSGSFDQYSTGFSLSQNIYDFGRTSTQVKIQKLGVDSSGADLENVSSQIVFNVKQAYYSVLQARRNRAVAAETVKQFEEHLAQAKGFFEVGTHPKFDVTKAEVDLSNAKLGMIRAENAVRLATATLNNAMGVPEAPAYLLEDNLSFAKHEITFEQALAAAYQDRPDLKSIVVRRVAAEEAMELAKRSYYPTLAGSAAYSWAGERFPLDNGWNVGLSLTFPIFSGFLTKYQVEEAKANIGILKANEESQRLAVFLDVQQAYLNLREAEERVPTAALAVVQARENLEIANGRYAAGVGNPIEVTDAQVAYTNAEVAHIQALSDYKVAKASLEKAMGRR